jgi:hypothetical protein
MTVDLPVPRPPTSALNYGLNFKIDALLRPIARAPLTVIDVIKCSGVLKGLLQ